MDTFDADLYTMVTARDVLQKQIDERLALRREEMLQIGSFYRERKTRRLAAIFRSWDFGSFRMSGVIVDCPQKRFNALRIAIR